MRTRDLGNAPLGVLLITIGLALFARQFLHTSGGFVLGVIGISFLVLFAMTRLYGLLIPGMIITGLAIGVGLEEAGYGYRGGTVLLGLGGGFLGIYVVGAHVPQAAHWWPLIPGGILTVIGAAQAIADTEAALFLGRVWPLALIIVGVWLFARARAKPRATGVPKDSSTPT